MGQLTPEQKEKQSKALKEAWAKRKASKTTTPRAAVDWEAMYNDAMRQLNAASNKITELEKICRTYATQAETSNKALQKSTLEYNARTQYMLDCVKHAYLSIQFATNAVESNKGEQ